MAKHCTYCHHTIADNETYCPACGKPYSGNAAAVQPPLTDAKPKSRLPYILLGVGIAAVIFVILLVVVLNTGSTKPSTSTYSSRSTASITGTYDWKNGQNGDTGTLVISGDNTAVFTKGDGSSLSLTFDPDNGTVSFVDSTGTDYNGTYSVKGNYLYVTFDGYTDTFLKQ